MRFITIALAALAVVAGCGGGESKSQRLHDEIVQAGKKIDALDRGNEQENRILHRMWCIKHPYAVTDWADGKPCA